jgi:hypothetical protein
MEGADPTPLRCADDTGLAFRLPMTCLTLSPPRLGKATQRTCKRQATIASLMGREVRMKQMVILAIAASLLQEAADASSDSPLHRFAEEIVWPQRV